jgi:2-aminoethylphosphonate dioxygenase
MATERELKVLTKEQLASLRRDGFLFLKAAEYFDDEELKKFKEWSEEVSVWPETPHKWMQYYEKSRHDGSRLLCRVEKFLDFHEGLNAMFNGGKFLQLMGDCFGEDAVLYKEKVNFKLPGSDGFKPHQDAQAGWDSYGHTLHLSVLISIDPATPDNGCLEAVAGRQKEGLLGPMWKELPDEFTASVDWQTLETQPGDIVIFDSYVPHRSGINQTDAPRRVMYLTYNRAGEGDYRQKYYSDKRESFPPDIEREPGKEYAYKI